MVIVSVDQEAEWESVLQQRKRKSSSRHPPTPIHTHTLEKKDERLMKSQEISDQIIS